jgi:hypothetical protein
VYSCSLRLLSVQSRAFCRIRSKFTADIERASRGKGGRKWKVLNMKPIFSVQFSFMEEEGNIIKYTCKTLERHLSTFSWANTISSTSTQRERKDNVVHIWVPAFLFSRLLPHSNALQYRWWMTEKWGLNEEVQKRSNHIQKYSSANLIVDNNKLLTNTR